MARLRQKAGAAGVEALPEEKLQENYRHRSSIHFAPHIGIIAAEDAYTAVHAAADEISKLLAQGMRFREIAVLCPDRATYEPLLAMQLARRGVPLFIDSQVGILSHPLVQLVRACLEIPLYNWSHDAVFAFLKTGLTPLTAEAVDVLENHALARGIKGYRWRYEIKDNAEAECGRSTLFAAMQPFAKLRAASKADVRAFAAKLVQVLTGMDVPARLSAWFDDALLGGDIPRARVIGQVWPKLMEVLDKLVDILGDERVTLAEFAEMLDAGLSGASLGLIPPTTDQVILGDATRSRYPQIRAMVVLGANENVLPAVRASGGLLTPQERQMLANAGLPLPTRGQAQVMEELAAIYQVLAQPTQRLVFIYTRHAADGKEMRPSPVISRFKSMLPGVEESCATPVCEYEARQFAPAVTDTLLAETAADIYGGERQSTAITRVEAFARCPFAYFAGSVLKAKPRALYEVLPSDLGVHFHAVMAEFVKLPNAQSLTRSQVAAYVSDIMDKIVPVDSVYHSAARERHVLSKAKRAAAATAYAVAEQLRRGRLTPSATERDISLNLQGVHLHGRADRIDSYEKFAALFDYKSGNAAFSHAEVAAGTQLQLMLYLRALANEGKTPVGAFYFPVSEPLVDANESLPDAVLEEKLHAEFRPRGPAVAEHTELLGAVPKRTEIYSAEAFDALMALATDTAARLAASMQRGDIAARPHTKQQQKNPCRYCEFRSVCRGHG
jgi:ATP-dependent helicase/nuclease subunit B